MVSRWDNSSVQTSTIVGIVQDITHEKQAVERLQRSEERFRGIYEQTAVGMNIVSTEELGAGDYNQSFLDFVGYSRKELVDRI